MKNTFKRALFASVAVVGFAFAAPAFADNDHHHNGGHNNGAPIVINVNDAINQVNNVGSMVANAEASARRGAAEATAVNLGNSMDVAIDIDPCACVGDIKSLTVGVVNSLSQVNNVGLMSAAAKAKASGGSATALAANVGNVGTVTISVK